MQTLTLKSVALQLAVVALVAAGLLSFAMPARASGLTETQIQAIINLVASFGADQATISNVSAALRGQATSGMGSTNGSGFCHTFTYNQQSGSKMVADNNDLDALQQALIKEGYSINATERANGVWWFGASTVAAAKQFQAKYGISQTGYVGPTTRAKLNQLYGCH